MMEDINLPCGGCQLLPGGVGWSSHGQNASPTAGRGLIPSVSGRVHVSTHCVPPPRTPAPSSADPGPQAHPWGWIASVLLPFPPRGPAFYWGAPVYVGACGGDWSCLLAHGAPLVPCTCLGSPSFLSRHMSSLNLSPLSCQCRRCSHVDKSTSIK